jgi:hypothetical protein
MGTPPAGEARRYSVSAACLRIHLPLRLMTDREVVNDVETSAVRPDETKVKIVVSRGPRWR